MYKKKRPSTEYYHCSQCHKDLVGLEYKKSPIGFELREGKQVPHSQRFYVFCVACGSFLTIIDPEVYNANQKVSDKKS